MKRYLSVIGGRALCVAFLVACSGVQDETENIDSAREAIAHPTPNDLVVAGIPMDPLMPVARSNGDGTFAVTLANVGAFSTAVRASGAVTLTGDYNNDGLTDICVTGAASASSITCATATGNGQFGINGHTVGAFTTWASQSPVKIAHDFNADGRADIALLGGVGFGSIPIAFSTAIGTFSVTNGAVGLFGEWAANSAASKVAGDFDGDGDADIAIVGGGFTSIPVAFSRRDGTFDITNEAAGLFPSWASEPGAVRLVGDFNGDGRADIAVTGPSWFRSIPIAFSNGNGTFNVTNGDVGDFGVWAATTSAFKIVGDFNGDGRTDIALTGGGFGSLPVAFSNGNGTFNITNQAAGSFPALASTAGVVPLVGDYNFDGRTDIALAGGSGWATIPVAFSNGNGTFLVTNNNASAFTVRATGADRVKLAGNFQF